MSNDVANNMGPAVGANALTMGGAIAIAAILVVTGFGDTLRHGFARMTGQLEGAAHPPFVNF